MAVKRWIVGGSIVCFVIGLGVVGPRFFAGPQQRVRVSGLPGFAVTLRMGLQAAVVGPVVSKDTEYNPYYSKHSSRTIDNKPYDSTQVIAGSDRTGGEQVLEVLSCYSVNPTRSSHVQIQSKVPLFVLVDIPEGAVYESKGGRGGPKPLKNMRLPAGTYDWIIKPAENRGTHRIQGKEGGASS